MHFNFYFILFYIYIDLNVLFIFLFSQKSRNIRASMSASKKLQLIIIQSLVCLAPFLSLGLGSTKHPVIFGKWTSLTITSSIFGLLVKLAKLVIDLIKKDIVYSHCIYCGSSPKSYGHGRMCRLLLKDKRINFITFFVYNLFF